MSVRIGVVVAARRTAARGRSTSIVDIIGRVTGSTRRGEIGVITRWAPSTRLVAVAIVVVAGWWGAAAAIVVAARTVATWRAAAVIVVVTTRRAWWVAAVPTARLRGAGAIARALRLRLSIR